LKGTAAGEDLGESEAAATAGGDTPDPERRSQALSRPLILVALILATALSALDGTIVSTAMPAIVGALSGMPLYALVIAAYALTATTTVPIYGKLSDMYGRKPVFIAGAGLFIVGSALCGLAWNMPSLIAFRAVQGLGAGAVLPVSLTLIGDLFPLRERARIQGVFSAVWGVSSVVGPLIGGAIVQWFNWRWVFFINVPIGILASALFYIYLREPRIHTRQRIDVAGVLTLTFGVAALLVGLQVGSRDGWLQPTTLVALGAALALLATFALVERRAAAPMLTLELLARPVIAISCLVGLLSGGVLIGFGAYLPLLAQGAWGGSPIEAGLLVAPLSIGWPLASAYSARLLPRYGFRAITILGAALIALGTGILLLVVVPFVAAGPWLRAVTAVGGGFVAGAGMGFSATSMIIAVQNSVPWNERGISTAAVQFFRNMGNTVGAALLGAVLTATLTPLLAAPALRGLLGGLPASYSRAGSDPTLGPVNALLDLGVRDSLTPALRTGLQDALAASLGWVYLAMLAMAVGGALLAARFPIVVNLEED
jgi:EmrB/QacA subfamily drug resistance transporter